MPAGGPTMMQYVRRCSFICGAVLSLLLLLCSCQIGVGTGQFVQPPDISPDDSSQGKTQLLSALNQEYFHRVQISNHFIQGSDSAAETVFLYLEQNSGGDISKAVKSLTENREDGRVNCADAVLSRISPSSSETYWVSYSFLSADILEDGVLKEDAEFGPVAGKLIDHRNLLVSSDSYQPYDCQRSGFAVGVIGGQALVVAVFVS